MTSGPRDPGSFDSDAGLLIVEDDERMARLLTAILTQVGHEISIAGTAAAALDLLGEREFRLITLDVGLPDLSGAELVVHIRERSAAPIIMVSGQDDTRTVVDALGAGADDYVVKPFKPAELLARVRAVLRRVPPGSSEPESYADDVISIDFQSNRVVTPNGESALSLTERRLLMELVTHQRRVVTHNELLERVWGPGYDAANLHVFVNYLRRKVEPDPRHPRYIKTHRNVGYEFVPKDG